MCTQLMVVYRKCTYNKLKLVLLFILTMNATYPHFRGSIQQLPAINL